jgi:hypothetical protein
VTTASLTSDAVQPAPKSVNGRIKVLAHEHDQLIPLVIEGPRHLRSLRSRQLKSIEEQLLAAHLEASQIAP